MKSITIKMAAAVALLSASAVAFAAGGCCGSIECCLKMLGCC
jgi:hypothetical protein